MAFPRFLKIVALIALAVLAVNGDEARSLRSENNVVDSPVSRELSGKNPIGWIKIILKNIVNQPVSDKLYEKYKQINDKGKGK
ncbi:hypothetical protein PC129_g10529 [Phytophthora cactorum]|uniref:RxLR effector protein n=1 Tax=Phytophthora cactorum TaxID=29920 RepID=A0A329S136_9STRA|nr:hypothetical protein Pcac1_g18753 [Phytophthora cactorum]KAG2821841.1 hypothetical protein PC111_g10867 [Phytophthora cactorum]KAG2835157.1 hypothetical protein PC112_g5783 [Phytophthora cactorum]KAG2863402.1 hypothetical protein PC113_g5459 [Phytophthora cactorum]KAG2901453.1 hypothetical protein PC114_g13150 [Phytophthora cactorum]